MTGRERLLRSFEKKDVDRIPVSPFIYDNFIREFFKDPNVDLIQGTIDVYRHFGFDLMHRNIYIRFEETVFDSPEWKVIVSEDSNGRSKVVTTRINTPEKELKQVVQYETINPYQTVNAIKEWFIKDEEDFAQFVKYRPRIPKLDFPELIQTKLLIGDEGITAPWMWGGVFNYVADFRKLDDLLIDAVSEPDFYTGMIEYFCQCLIDYIGQVLDVGADVLSYSGNLASGTMVGPNFFKKYIFNHEKKLIDYIQGRGTHVLYHNCGDARSMYEVYNELGIHAFESLTEAPYADNDLKDAIDRFSEDVTLIGNLDQIDFLKNADPVEVSAKVKDKLDIIGSRKGFIFGTSDFIEFGTSHENLFTVAETVKKYGFRFYQGCISGESI